MLKEVLSVTEEQKEKITRFRRMGRSYAFIGNELGISKDTVKSFCRRNSLASADVSVNCGPGNAQFIADQYIATPDPAVSASSLSFCRLP